MKICEKNSHSKTEVNLNLSFDTFMNFSKQGVNKGERSKFNPRKGC